MYCKICDEHYPPFKIACFHRGEAIEAYRCPKGHAVGRCERFVFIQQAGQTTAGVDRPCETCSDRAFCLATFQR